MKCHDIRPAGMLLALTLLCPGAAPAQGWTPQKNVEIVVPVAPGGTNDKIARAIAYAIQVGPKTLYNNDN
jgi:tripartite-type tricarboxylate transporter receptor subunit TctC